jgi:hypothetical protein
MNYYNIDIEPTHILLCLLAFLGPFLISVLGLICSIATRSRLLDAQTHLQTAIDRLHRSGSHTSLLQSRLRAETVRVSDATADVRRELGRIVTRQGVGLLKVRGDVGGFGAEVKLLENMFMSLNARVTRLTTDIVQLRREMDGVLLKVGGPWDKQQQPVGTGPSAPQDDVGLRGDEEEGFREEEGKSSRKPEGREETFARIRDTRMDAQTQESPPQSSSGSRTFATVVDEHDPFPTKLKYYMSGGRSGWPVEEDNSDASSTLIGSDEEDHTNERTKHIQGEGSVVVPTIYSEETMAEQNNPPQASTQQEDVAAQDQRAAYQQEMDELQKVLYVRAQQENEALFKREE